MYSYKRKKNWSKGITDGNYLNSATMIVWTYEKDDRQQTTDEDTWMEKEEKETESNFGAVFSLYNEKRELGDWKEKTMESSNKLLKWVQEYIHEIIKPDNK